LLKIRVFWDLQHGDWYIDTEVLKNRTAFIFRLRQSSKNLLDLEDERVTMLQNVCNYLPVDTP
jgi:hypothetical protein